MKKITSWDSSPRLDLSLTLSKTSAAWQAETKHQQLRGTFIFRYLNRKWRRFQIKTKNLKKRWARLSVALRLLFLEENACLYCYCSISQPKLSSLRNIKMRHFLLKYLKLQISSQHEYVNIKNKFVWRVIQEWKTSNRRFRSFESETEFECKILKIIFIQYRFQAAFMLIFNIRELSLTFQSSMSSMWWDGINTFFHFTYFTQTQKGAMRLLTGHIRQFVQLRKKIL